MSIVIVYGVAILLIILAASFARKGNRGIVISIEIGACAVGVILFGEAFLKEPLAKWFDGIPH